MIFRMAWRNLWRHRGRTIIMTTAVAFTYGIMLVAMGINDDAHRRMLEEAANAAGGEVIVHAEEYWDTRASDLVIADASRVLDHIASLPGVRAVMPRIIINGLVSTSSGTQPVFLQGVDPSAEANLTDPAADVVEGTFLTGDISDPIVLGSLLVEELELQLGDRVVLTASDVTGEVTRALFHLTGITQTGSRDIDLSMAYTTIAAAQSAVLMDDMLTQIGVLGQDGTLALALAVTIAHTLGVEAQTFEVLSWQHAVPEMVGFTELDDAFGYIYLGVILAVVLFSIANTFLMAVLERVRELGLLSALGLRGSRLARLLLTETLLMTTIAMAIGLLLGLSGHFAAAHWGIPLSAWGLEEMEVAGVDFSTMVMYSELRPMKWLIGSIVVAVATVGSSLYPAWRATRLAPAEAMRFFA